MNTDDAVPAPTAASLRELLAEHERAVVEARHNEFLDVDLVSSLHRKLGLVLDRWDSFDEAQQGHIVRTVQYLVDMDDEEHDLRSPIGLIDDDEQVTGLLAEIAPDLLS